MDPIELVDVPVVRVNPTKEKCQVRAAKRMKESKKRQWARPENSRQVGAVQVETLAQLPPMVAQAAVTAKQASMENKARRVWSRLGLKCCTYL